MIALGFDVGRKKTGIAIANWLTRRATPLAVVRGKKTRQLESVARVIEQWRPVCLVVGAPRHLDGKKHSMTAVADAFADSLQKQFLLAVHRADERLTTVAAAQLGGDDSVAAGMILQDWLAQNPAIDWQCAAPRR